MTQHAFLTSATDAPVEVLPRDVARSAPRRATLLRKLGAHRLGSYWLARSLEDDRPLLAYELSTAARERASRGAGQSTLGFRHRHVLEVIGTEWIDDQLRWLLLPYPGTHEGIVSLDHLITLKIDQRVGALETIRAVRQLLGLLDAARVEHIDHGPLRIDEVLIDSHGRLIVPLFGLENALGLRSSSFTMRDQVRAVFEIGRELVTGASGGDQRLGLPRSLAPDASAAMREWILKGRGEESFPSPRAALRALPI